VLSETSIKGREPREFLENAVDFLNEQVWGTLCAGLVVHPAAFEEPGMVQAVEGAIQELRYGSISVNTWPAAVYGLGSLPWGGHPSSTRADIQSGNGFVHNPYMLEGVEKSVLRAPLSSFPPPPWLAGHRSLRALTRRLMDFEDAPSWLKLPGLALDAARG
jgi:aldehyde dehydrogenase (NAD(P)+)